MMMMIDVELLSETSHLLLLVHTSYQYLSGDITSAPTLTVSRCKLKTDQSHLL